MTIRRRQHSELVWITENAGLTPGSSYAVTLPQKPLPSCCSGNLHLPCELGCGNPECRQWTAVLLLPGNTRKEAIRNLIASQYSGVAYQVPECQMLDTAMTPDEIRETLTIGQRAAAAEGFFRRKAHATWLDEDAMALLQDLNQQIVVETDGFDFAHDSIALAKLTAAHFAEIGAKSIWITERGMRFANHQDNATKFTSATTRSVADPRKDAALGEVIKSN